MTFDKQELKYLRIIASVVGFIGVAGLVALLAQGAFAADVPPSAGKGLQPGARTFTNPFANVNPGGQPAGKNNFFDDDEEDDDMPPNGNVPPPVPPPPGGYAGGNAGGGGGNAGGGSLNAGGSPQSANGPNATFGPSGVSVGGGTAGGVIEHNGQRAVHIDDETGEGSKEIVTDFNYPDADIMDIAKTLGRLMGKNFIYDKDVKGRISILSNGPITVGDAWKAFLTALDINGFALIPSGRYIRIARQRDARDKQLKTYTGDFSPDTDALITRVFPLKYIQAEEVARTFRSFMPANSRIIPYEQTNTVIVTDTGSNIAKLNKMLELLDVEGYDAGIEVIPVKYASAAELSKLIDALIPGTGGPAGAPGAPRFGGGGSKFQSRRTKEGGIINTIISDDRTNTLIVHANTKGADQVRELVAKLDQKQPAITGGGKVHVIYLQFAEAEKIAATLNNISSQAASGFRPTTPGGGAGTGVNPVAASLFEGQIKVSPDVATNALVVTASPADFVTVERVIARLDIPRDEVYVECIVMEVDISRGANYSANIISVPSGLGSVTNSSDLLSFLQNPAASSGAILGFVGGKQTTITGPNGQQTTVSSLQGLIKAIQSYAKTNVLSTPQIIALDNTEANFSSAEKIPVPQQTAVQGAGVTTSVTKESIELSIKIKPQINKISNFVKLETEVKIGDIVANGNVPSVAGVPVFTTQDRTAKTTVVVGDSDTIVIGGLIRDKIDENVSKIPILGDIPVLGWLFKSKNTTVTKTNLLVFLTPHIVRQYEKVRALLDRKLKDRDDFIEKEAGGEDPERPARDDIIRNLPDIKDITAKRPNSSVTIDEETPAAKEVAPDGDPFTGGGNSEKTGGGNSEKAGGGNSEKPGGSGTKGGSTRAGGSDTAPAVPTGTNGAALNVPALPPSGSNTGAAEPAAPAPPVPGAQPATPPHSGSGT